MHSFNITQFDNSGFVGKQRFTAPPSQPPPVPNYYRGHSRGGWTYKNPHPLQDNFFNKYHDIYFYKELNIVSINFSEGAFWRHPIEYHQPSILMEKNKSERLLDPPEVYQRLRECTSRLQMNNEQLAEKFGISRAYIQKILTGKNAISGSAIKAFIVGGLDIQYIFTGHSDREEILNLKKKIETVKELLKEAYNNN